MKVYHILTHSLEPVHKEITNNPQAVTTLTGNLHKFVSALIKNDNKKQFNHTIVYLSNSLKINRLALTHKSGYKIILIKNEISIRDPIEYSFELIKFLKETKDGIFHVHGTSSYIFDSIAPVLHKKPSIVHYRGGQLTLKSFPIAFPKYLFLNYLSLRMPEYIFFQNREKLNEFKNLYFLNPEKLIYIPNGIDPELYKKDQKKITEWKKKLKIKKGEIILLFIGRLAKGKGIYETLESFQNLRKKYKNLRLLVIGNNSDFRQIDGVDFLGDLKFNLQDVLAVTYNSNIYVLPTYSESFPNSILESMACGIPVISTNISGVRELIKDNETGILVQPKNAKSLELAIEKLINDESLRTNLAEKGKDYIYSNFLWSKIAVQVFTIYKKLGKKYSLKDPNK